MAQLLLDLDRKRAVGEALRRVADAQAMGAELRRLEAGRGAVTLHQLADHFVAEPPRERPGAAHWPEGRPVSPRPQASASAGQVRSPSTEHPRRLAGPSWSVFYNRN